MVASPGAVPLRGVAASADGSETRARGHTDSGRLPQGHDPHITQHIKRRLSITDIFTIHFKIHTK